MTLVGRQKQKKAEKDESRLWKPEYNSDFFFSKKDITL